MPGVFSFYIKTIAFYDHCGNPLDDGPILTEQVYTNIDENRSYDTSTIFNDNKIYYFKRIHEEDNYNSDQPKTSLKLFCYDFL